MVNKNKIIVTSSSPLTDRMLIYSEFIKKISELYQPKIWATSFDKADENSSWRNYLEYVESFPKIRPPREFPVGDLKRINNFIWDSQLRSNTRESIDRHVRKYNKRHRIARSVGKLLLYLPVSKMLETILEKSFVTFERSLEVRDKLKREKPSLLLITGPHRLADSAAAATAKRLKIPILALITSWDNISTKNRLNLNYDGYLVWSERMREELYSFYPESLKTPVYIIGAPQFDTFFQPRFCQTRKQFCQENGLDADRPIIVYGLGSPNLLKEVYGAIEFSRRVMAGDLGDVQLLVRPHPLFDYMNLEHLFKEFDSKVKVQQTSVCGKLRNGAAQDENQIRNWVNTFRHADVVVNLSSTITVDAALFDRPVVNLDFDPEPDKPNQQLVKDINHLWTHFKPVAESGGVWLADDMNSVVEGVKTYLIKPELHREQRRWITEHVCGYADGKSGERLTQAVLDFVAQHVGKSS